MWTFLSRTYWQRLRERPGLLVTAAVLVLVPFVLAWIWGANDPGAAYGVVPDQFRNRGGDPVAGSLSTSDEAGFAGQIFTNNIRVTFLAVAAGITLGLGSAALAIYNGDASSARSAASRSTTGRRSASSRWSSGHGVLELSCIVVGVMAGLRIGFAIVDPGRRARLDALRAEFRPAMEIVLGTMPWLVLAGLVEGFFTGSGPTLVPSVILGVDARRRVLGARVAQRRARAFARRYALTHAAARPGRGRLDRLRAGAREQRRGAVAGVRGRRARPPRRRASCAVARGPRGARSSVLRAGDDDRVAAGEDGDRVGQRAGRRSPRSGR